MEKQVESMYSETEVDEMINAMPEEYTKSFDYVEQAYEILQKYIFEDSKWELIGKQWIRKVKSAPSSIKEEEQKHIMNKIFMKMNVLDDGLSTVMHDNCELLMFYQKMDLYDNPEKYVEEYLDNLKKMELERIFDSYKHELLERSKNEKRNAIRLRREQDKAPITETD